MCPQLFSLHKVIEVNTFEKGATNLALRPFSEEELAMGESPGLPIAIWGKKELAAKKEKKCEISKVRVLLEIGKHF